MAFLCLYLAVRSGNVNLRAASIKEMAALFFAFNRPHYQKLISQHLSDLLTLPHAIQQRGYFVVSIKGRQWHSVAIDEAHEMMINKDLKSAIVRPNKEIMDRLSLYLGHRVKLLRNLQNHLNQTHLDSDVEKTTQQREEH